MTPPTDPWGRAADGPRTPRGPARRPLILVVDDEETILAMLQLALPPRGFDVRTAAAGAEAVAAYRADPAVDLVLIDVVMPGMDGPATLRALRAVNPAVRCCFLTGESDRYADEDLLSLDVVGILKKPFSLDRLAQMLRLLV